MSDGVSCRLLALLVGVMASGLLLETLRAYEVDPEIRGVWAGVVAYFALDVARALMGRRAR